MTDETKDEDPWGIGTVITVDHPLHATVMAWQSIEEFLVEIGLSQSNAEKASRIICARLARLDPPVLVCHPSEMRDE